MSLSQEFKDYERHMIETFFVVKVPRALGSHDVVCNEDLCKQFAKSILPVDDMVPVDNQGSNSFTLISQQESRIIQFRLQPFNMEILGLAHQIYGDKVPQTIFHPGFPLPVYSSNVIPGKVHFLQDFPDSHFPLERQLRTVIDLGSFIARSTWYPQSQQCDSNSWTATSGKTVDRLLHNNSLQRLAPELLPLLQKLQSQLPLLDQLPRVLTHHDLAEINILVDEQGHVTGVVDFDDAGIEAFGMCIWGIYECFLGEMTKGQWSFFNQDAVGVSGKTVREVLEAAFWSTIWSSVSPQVPSHSEDFREAVKVAVRIGVIGRYFIRGMLDEIDETDKIHRSSMEYVRGILPSI